MRLCALEYAFEFERNRSYQDLIRVAIAELKPDDEAENRINEALY